MGLVIVTGRVTEYVEEEFRNKTIAEAVAIVRKQNPGVDIETINDRHVAGFCESCGKPLYAGQRYYSDAEGIRWCRSHGAAGDE